MQEVVKIDPSRMLLVIGKNSMIINYLAQEFNIKIDIHYGEKIIIMSGNMQTKKIDLHTAAQRVREIVG